jgi:hypothetical protein
MRKTIKVAFIILALAIFIGACLPAPSDLTPSVGITSTPSLDTRSQINTAVAQTVEVQNQIGTAVALTTEAQFTSTPLAIPTLTPFVFLTLTPKPNNGGVPHKVDYSCDIIRLRPKAYAEFKRGQDFDIKMTVVNNGTRGWYHGFDLKYSGGTQMTSTTRVELPAMLPGDKYEVVLDAIAPKERGNQVMTWMVEGQICFGYVVINVK